MPRRRKSSAEARNASNSSMVEQSSEEGCLAQAETPDSSGSSGQRRSARRSANGATRLTKKKSPRLDEVDFKKANDAFDIISRTEELARRSAEPVPNSEHSRKGRQNRSNAELMDAEEMPSNEHSRKGRQNRSSMTRAEDSVGVRLLRTRLEDRINNPTLKDSERLKALATSLELETSLELKMASGADAESAPKPARKSGAKPEETSQDEKDQCATQSSSSNTLETTQAENGKTDRKRSWPKRRTMQKVILPSFDDDDDVEDVVVPVKDTSPESDSDKTSAANTGKPSASM